MTRIYDLVMTHKLDADDLFIHRVQQHCAEQGMIDYVNDQCHMLSQSSNPQMGVPDELVSAIARRLVEGVSQMIKR